MPNERWQADLTTGNSPPVSRSTSSTSLTTTPALLVTSHARSTTKAADIVASFHTAAARYGLPASLLTDNGAVFTAAPRRGGRCPIELELATLASPPVTPAPTIPDLRQGRALPPDRKRWLARQPTAVTVAELQAQLDRFASYDNTRRPHRALGRRPPTVAFTARPKASPSRPGLIGPQHSRVRRDRVDRSGVITLRHNSRLHHIGLGRQHAGTRVLVLVADLEVRVITQDGTSCASSPSTPAATPAPAPALNMERSPGDRSPPRPETSQCGAPRNRTGDPILTVDLAVTAVQTSVSAARRRP
jgi:hypothetical protein